MQHMNMGFNDTHNINARSVILLKTTHNINARSVVLLNGTHNINVQKRCPPQRYKQY